MMTMVMMMMSTMKKTVLVSMLLSAALSLLSQECWIHITTREVRMVLCGICTFERE